MKSEYLDTYYNQRYVFTEIKKYFKPTDFYRRAAINCAKRLQPNNFEDLLWSRLDFRLLSNLLYIRITLGKKIYANYADNPQLDERGVRDNLSDTVKGATKNGNVSFTAHAYGSALDFDVSGMKAEDVRIAIKEFGEDMPFACRFEHKSKGTPIGWVHMDTCFELDNPYICLFNI